MVAYDKKGNPVTDLKPEEFEIYDNGRRQEIRFFGTASGASAEDSRQSAWPTDLFQPRRGSWRRQTWTRS